MASDPMEGVVIVDLLRSSYPHLSEPSDVRQKKDRLAAPDDPKLRYNTQLIIDAVTHSAPNAKEQLQRLILAVRNAALEKLNKNPAAATFLTERLFGKQGVSPEGKGGIYSPFRDGSKMADGSPNEAAGYGPGTITFKVQSKFVIPCVGTTRVVIPTPLADGVFYPGCYVRAALRARAQPYAGNDSVAIDAVGLMLMRDGERLDSRVDPEALFGGLDVSDPDDLSSLFAGAR